MFPLNSSEGDPAQQSYTDYERELLDKVAKKVVYWKMAVPAIMTLESLKPLNYIGSQAMVFFEPIVQSLFSFKDYDTFRAMLERRETIEHLLLRIEHFDATASRKEKLFKKLRKEYLSRQTFSYRLRSKLFGFKVPRHLEDEWRAKMDAIDAESESQTQHDSRAQSS